MLIETITEYLHRKEQPRCTQVSADKADAERYLRYASEYELTLRYLKAAMWYDVVNRQWVITDFDVEMNPPCVNQCIRDFLKEVKDKHSFNLRPSLQAREDDGLDS